MDLRQLHREAVELAKEASKALQTGDTVQYLELAGKAFEKGKKASLALEKGLSINSSES